MVNAPPEYVEIGRFVRALRMARPALIPDTKEAEDTGRRRRHVPYLTQTELAGLVGVSTVVISQIEQGRYPNLTQATLRKITSALGLTGQNELYLLSLHNKRTQVQRGKEAPPSWITELVSTYEHPAMVVNPAYDVMAINSGAKSMLGSHAGRFIELGSIAEAVFQFEEMRTFFLQWERIARATVSGMRMGYGVHPDCRQHTSAVAKMLGEASDKFRHWWNQDNPLVDSPVETQFMHPELGVLNIIMLTSVIVEAPQLTMIEFLPTDTETREKLLHQQG